MGNFYYRTSHCIDCWISTERDEINLTDCGITSTNIHSDIIKELGSDIITVDGYQCPECIKIDNLNMPEYAEEEDKRHEYVESKYPQDFEHFKSEILTQRKEHKKAN